MTAILAAFWPYIAGAVAFIAGALGIYAKGRSDAKAKRKASDLKETIKAHEARNEVDTDAAAAPDPRQRLRDDWKR